MYISEYIYLYNNSNTKSYAPTTNDITLYAHTERTHKRIKRKIAHKFNLWIVSTCDIKGVEITKQLH